MCVLITFVVDSVLRGYRIYKDAWSAGLDSELPCSRVCNREETSMSLHTHAPMH